MIRGARERGTKGNKGMEMSLEIIYVNIAEPFF